MNELEEVRVFITLVECHSASKAAEKLGVANSAISRRMKALEERLGVQLLQRTTRTMHLTDDGQIYYERCKRLLDEWNDAEQEVMQSATALTGNIHVSMPLSLGISHLSPIIADFMLENPGVSVNLDLSDRRVDVIEDGFDIVFRIGHLEDSSLIARQVTQVRHMVYCSPQLAEQYGPFDTPNDLRKIPTFGYSNLRHPGRWPYTAPDGAKGEIRLSPKILSNNGEALMAAAERNLGAGCQPTFILHEAFSSGRLVPLLTDYQWFGMNLYAVYPRARHLSRRVRALLDYVIERLGKRPYWDDCLEAISEAQKPANHAP
ncbi:LysR family transcriptional regulator [Thalassolituus sp.]|uniref:LysR family transcriptional regulator n=1 Tax=Thalassolituus sp. TaxID=2030822 RepID=UPI0035166C90